MYVQWRKEGRRRALASRASPPPSPQVNDLDFGAGCLLLKWNAPCCPPRASPTRPSRPIMESKSNGVDSVRLLKRYG